MSTIPSQQQMLLPLLLTLSERGPSRSRDLYEPIAERTKVDAESRQATTDIGGRDFNLFERAARWTQQRAKFMGYVRKDDQNIWSLTEAGKNTIGNIRPGAIVTVYESDEGIALWAEAEAAVQVIQDHSVNLLITSPPYPLLKKKVYAGQHPEAEHVQWLADFFALARRKLVPDGSIMINLGPVWTQGAPTMSLYAERLLLKLCDEIGLFLNQRLFWHNPSKMPSPAEWVTVRRVRLTPSVEDVFWLSTSPHPKANNRNVLRPYSESMKRRLAVGGENACQRPSGHVLTEGAFATDNGGSIAHSLMSFANTRSNDAYQRYCRDNGLPAHPARFPEELAEFLIKLTTDQADTVYDPFGGSQTTAAVAQRLGRRWITSEKSLDYIRGGLGGRLALPLQSQYQR